MLEKALKREYERLEQLKDYYFFKAMEALSANIESEYEVSKIAYLKVKAQMDAIEEELGYV